MSSPGAFQLAYLRNAGPGGQPHHLQEGSHAWGPHGSRKAGPAGRDQTELPRASRDKAEGTRQRHPTSDHLPGCYSASVSVIMAEYHDTGALSLFFFKLGMSS